MDQSTYNSLKAFIFGIANDCLVDVYDVGDYRKIILPMFVIRRFDALLEPVHDKVIQALNNFQKNNNTADYDPALCHIAGQAFVNKSAFTLKDLASVGHQQTLKMDFINYLDGFSQNVQDIIDKFKFRSQIDYLSQKDRLGLLISKFVDPNYNFSSVPVLDDKGNERIPALDNHTMGTLFEDVIRTFNETTNVTDAGRHFTPRDVVNLVADLAFIPVQDKIQDTTYRIYDGACGTGGMLTVGEERIKALAKTIDRKVSIKLFGQENGDETFAIAKADMIIKGDGNQAPNIKYGSTISEDQFSKETFDFMLMNPPFGTSWKADLKTWGDIKKEEIDDPRFVVNYGGDAEFSLVPDIGDPQMLFLANNISKMKESTELGSRIVEIHNGSSLFTGDAGQGPSNLRRYIIENDLLEAIVALPEKMFYNTGIGTFIWIVTNKKDSQRKGKVQLIDATTFKKPLRKNLGEKNCEVSQEDRDRVIDLYMAFDKADSEYSRVFENKEFGYWAVKVQRPLRLRTEVSKYTLINIPLEMPKETAFYELMKSMEDEMTEELAMDFNVFQKKLNEKAKATNTKLLKKHKDIIRKFFTEIDENAMPVLNPKGGYEPDKNLEDKEKIPLLYDGGVDGFFEKEIKPYTDDAWIDKDSMTIGYELSFTKYFYKPVELREVADIIADIEAIEKNTDGLLASIIGGGE